MSKSSARKPASHTMSVADFVSKHLSIQADMGRNQRIIADEVGYPKPNMISMFGTGQANVPLDKVPALAEALRVDPGLLFRLALAQYWPGREKAIAEIFGTVLTKEETKIIEIIRSVTKGDEIKVTGDIERKLKAIFR